MQRRKSIEEWEETKSRLIRSMFVRLSESPEPRLEPIPEHPPLEIPAPIETTDDSEESLPDLIVEKVPHRLDDHEPLERFERLHRLSIKYYKKLFDIQDDSSSTDFEDYIYNPCDETGLVDRNNRARMESAFSPILVNRRRMEIYESCEGRDSDRYQRLNNEEVEESDQNFANDNQIQVSGDQEADINQDEAFSASSHDQEQLMENSHNREAMITRNSELEEELVTDDSRHEEAFSEASDNQEESLDKDTGIHFEIVPIVITDEAVPHNVEEAFSEASDNQEDSLDKGTGIHNEIVPIAFNTDEIEPHKVTKSRQDLQIAVHKDIYDFTEDSFQEPAFSEGDLEEQADDDIETQEDDGDNETEKGQEEITERNSLLKGAVVETSDDQVVTENQDNIVRQHNDQQNTEPISGKGIDDTETDQDASETEHVNQRDIRNISERNVNDHTTSNREHQLSTSGSESRDAGRKESDEKEADDQLEVRKPEANISSGQKPSETGVLGNNGVDEDVGAGTRQDINDHDTFSTLVDQIAEQMTTPDFIKHSSVSFRDIIRSSLETERMRGDNISPLRTSIDQVTAQLNEIDTIRCSPIRPEIIAPPLPDPNLSLTMTVEREITAEDSGDIRHDTYKCFDHSLKTYRGSESAKTRRIGFRSRRYSPIGPSQDFTSVPENQNQFCPPLTSTPPDKRVRNKRANSEPTGFVSKRRSMDVSIQTSRRNRASIGVQASVSMRSVGTQTDPPVAAAASSQNQGDSSRRNDNYFYISTHCSIKNHVQLYRI